MVSRSAGQQVSRSAGQQVSRSAGQQVSITASIQTGWSQLQSLALSRIKSRVDCDSDEFSCCRRSRDGSHTSECCVRVQYLDPAAPCDEPSGGLSPNEWCTSCWTNLVNSTH
jgi:hypothetical protein